MLERIRELESLVDPSRAAPLSEARERLERATFVLAVVGEFSSGKSFLLNALLGTFGLLATDINPTTATITELEYAPETTAYALYGDGREERIPIDRLSRFVAVASAADAGALHDATQDECAAPIRVRINVDSEFLSRGFTVADTPGLASINPAHRRATLHFLPRADAVLYLIDTQQPFSEGDASFLGIIRQHLDTIFIVQTKIDLWEETGVDGRPLWESARDRIRQLAAVHAPGTVVYALSSRLYVEGVQRHDERLVRRSHFREFVAALDASLVQTTGRARLQRSRQHAAIAAREELAQLAQDREMLSLPEDVLHSRLAEAKSAIAQIQDQVARSLSDLSDSSAGLMQAVQELGAVLLSDAEHALERAFDAADIAVLQDRARLHILIDRTLGAEVETFGAQVSEAIFAEYTQALAAIPQGVNVNLAFAQAASAAFGDPGTSSLWMDEPQRALAAAILLQAIGGPSISLVHAISTRFAGARVGSYMKRELTADLRTSIWPVFRQEMQRFTETVVHQLAAITQTLSASVRDAMNQRRDRAVGSVERALARRASGENLQTAASTLRQREERIETLLTGLDELVDAFVLDDAPLARPATGADAVLRSHVEAEFDREAYRMGLRPQRWRVAVVGALRRGKSSLINAFAGRRVLADEVAGAIAYPVHVRYGEQEAAFALQAGGEWREVEVESALEEAARNPVLIVTPWQLPRELVLVHAPAFDAGDATLEDICVVAAREASEILCLFSRQLSDRELGLYERIAALGKPMMFAHTLADNETASERRHVVELAEHYLRQRNIPAVRTFVVSTLEYAHAKRERRAPAGWNELDALISTISSHAEEHMSRLARLERIAAATASTKQPPAETARGLFARLFRGNR